MTRAGAHGVSPAAESNATFSHSAVGYILAFRLCRRQPTLENNWFFDKRLFTTSGTADTIAFADTPFLVGGFMYIQMPWGEWGHLFDTMEGYIDEVHISRGLRYGRNRERIRPSRNFRRDDSTIALWRFEEGPGAPIYRDSSGNGHHLVPAAHSLSAHTA